MQTEQLKIEELLPTKFEPKVNRRFILDMDCIPSYIVKSVHTPPLVPNDAGKLIPKNFHFVKKSHRYQYALQKDYMMYNLLYFCIMKRALNCKYRPHKKSISNLKAKPGSMGKQLIGPFG